MKKYLVETRVVRVADDGQPLWGTWINGKRIQISAQGETPMDAEFRDQPDAETWGTLVVAAQYLGRASQIDYRTETYIPPPADIPVERMEDWEREGREHAARMAGSLDEAWTLGGQDD